MEKCAVEKCAALVAKAGHQLCFKHWKAEKNGGVARCSGCTLWFEGIQGQCTTCSAKSATEDASAETGAMWSSTRIGKHVGLSSSRINLILAERGWIEKYVKGWVPTETGNRQGAEVREMRQSGVPYVVWPASIVDNNTFMTSVRETLGHVVSTSTTAETTTLPETQGPSNEFRSRFPAEHRTQDGHLVRSRAEVLIDNWLYMQKIVHAYERKLPIEEDVYCDFYLPTGQVYIEYWGMENDPRYAKRLQTKRAIYEKYKLSLIELSDPDILCLDDVLPRQLLKHAIECT